MYLVDTDVLSGLRRVNRNPALEAWISSQRTTDLHLSVVTIGEIERGITQQQQHDPRFADALASWLDQVLRHYANRILAVDVPIARRWGELSASVGHTNADVLIAATAFEHGLTVVTNNVRHFKQLGVPVLNPFT